MKKLIQVVLVFLALLAVSILWVIAATFFIVN